MYPLIRALKKIPLNKYPRDFLSTLKYWWYNGVTGEAVIEDEGKKVLVQVYDPISLINFSTSDLATLHKNKILFHEECRSYAMQFQKFVDFYVKKGIHAGSLLPMNWAE